MFMFYEEMMGMMATVAASPSAGDVTKTKPMNLSIAQALRSAQLRLRAMTDNPSTLQECVEKIAAGIEKFIPRKSAKKIIGPNSRTFWLERLRARRTDDMDDPRYWANYVLTGDGFQVLWPK
jgi:CHAT domain-containing protein